jgi:hypothetical protein
MRTTPDFSNGKLKKKVKTNERIYYLVDGWDHWGIATTGVYLCFNDHTHL